MKAMAQALISGPDDENDEDANFDFEDTEADDVKNAALNEIERHQRIDSWDSSYQNILSDVAIDVRIH